MTDNDEETKEHPVYRDVPAPVEPVPADRPPGEPAAPASAKVDPLEPTTTINVAPAVPPTYPQPPSQGWSGPPPGAANLPGQWQPTPQGQQAYGGPPAYPAAQTWGAAAPTYGTSVFVALAAMLLVIMGVVLALLGAWLLTQGPALSDLVQRLRSVDLVVFEPTRDQLRSPQLGALAGRRARPAGAAVQHRRPDLDIGAGPGAVRTAHRGDRVPGRLGVRSPGADRRWRPLPGALPGPLAGR
jgi:hypothetical protein